MSILEWCGKAALGHESDPGPLVLRTFCQNLGKIRQCEPALDQNSEPMNNQVHLGPQAGPQDLKEPLFLWIVVFKNTLSVPKFIFIWSSKGFLIMPHGMCYSHYGNGVRNGTISIVQWGLLSDCYKVNPIGQ